ncbi:MAG TPA: hypothetical protein P5114_03775 [Hyphomicrobiaceae bacterium]|nr:hypothetical protein [Hyphomicrobiaceae bacterium]
MLNKKSDEIVLHLYSGEPVRIAASDVTYIDEDRGSTGAVKGTRIVVSALDDQGNPVNYCVRELCETVARQLSEIVGVTGVGDD